MHYRVAYFYRRLAWRERKKSAPLVVSKNGFGLLKQQQNKSCGQGRLKNIIKKLMVKFTVSCTLRLLFLTLNFNVLELRILRERFLFYEMVNSGNPYLPH